MKNFNPNNYFNTKEVEQALSIMFVKEGTKRERKIQEVYCDLKGIHGDCVHISFTDVCDVLNNQL